MMTVFLVDACTAKLFLFSCFRVCTIWPLLGSGTDTAVTVVQVPVGITFATGTVECPQLRSTNNHVGIGFLGSAICHSIYSSATPEQGCINLFTLGSGLEDILVPLGALIIWEIIFICASQHMCFSLGLAYLGFLCVSCCIFQLYWYNWIIQSCIIQSMYYSVTVLYSDY